MTFASESVRVGLFPSVGETSTGSSYLADIHDAGIDYVCVGDHVSFFVGVGLDGLVNAASLAAQHPTLPVMTGVYLLPLRHPVLVARQLADLGQLAPGRLIFGVGIGGEDRHEVEICGVDPATRGRRMEECLAIVRQLLTGKPATFHGEFFDLDDALVLPAPASPIPIIVGGRSNAAVRRAGRLGDGWLGIWNSASRFAEALEIAATEAARIGRDHAPTRNAMQLWCGIDDTKERARARLAPAMQSFYQIPFERFEKYSPYGTPEDIVEFLLPYVEAGCGAFNLIPQAGDRETALAGAAAVKKLLAGS
jgi:alkanesulfonate monooxygenase SsuD/methylene tetrahydromethanopterin reductase-like flavin-dependent oxidoreductase (luciferase family)